MADFEVRQAVYKVCPCALSASETEAKSTVHSSVVVGDGGHKDKMHGTYSVTS